MAVRLTPVLSPVADSDGVTVSEAVVLSVSLTRIMTPNAWSESPHTGAWAEPEQFALYPNALPFESTT